MTSFDCVDEPPASRLAPGPHRVPAHPRCGQLWICSALAGDARAESSWPVLSPALNESVRGGSGSVDPRQAAVRVCEWLRAGQIPDDALALGTEPVPIPRSDGWFARLAGHSVVLMAADGSTREIPRGELVAVPSRTTRSVPGRDVGRPRSSGRSVVLRRIADEVRAGRFDRGVRAELAATARRFGPRALRAPAGLGPLGGMVWRAGADELVCWDGGGFWDDNPNTEADAWAPQAMGIYYADAFAAAAFAVLAVDDDAWSDPARAALGHVGRTYHEYPQAPIWYHHEFKNAPFLEAARALRTEPQLPVSALHGDSYEPTNVMAVRLHWLAARGLTTAGDRRRYQHALARLQRAQRPSGLVLDDRPSITSGVHDIAYHQFTMAFLARVLEHRDDVAVRDILRRGLDYTADLQLGDGSVAITGRGTANTYQAACAVYALTVGADLFGEPGYRCAATRAFAWLARWQLADGSFPVAANNRHGTRMGWNHCATPYNALIAYFLLHACRHGLAPRENAAQVPARSSPRLRGRSARLDAGRSSVAVVGGYDGGHVWSGAHRPGVAGLAALTVGDDVLTLAVDELVDGLEVTDLPDASIDGVRVNWRTPGRLTVEKSVVRYEVDVGGVRVGAVYHLAEESLSITSFLRARRAVTVEVFPRIALLASTPCELVDGPGGMPERVDVPSNPRGPGVLLRWPASLVALEPEGIWEAVVRVRLSPAPAADR